MASFLGLNAQGWPNGGTETHPAAVPLALCLSAMWMLCRTLFSLQKPTGSWSSSSSISVMDKTHLPSSKPHQEVGPSPPASRSALGCIFGTGMLCGSLRSTRSVCSTTAAGASPSQAAMGTEKSSCFSLFPCLFPPSTSYVLSEELYCC